MGCPSSGEISEQSQDVGIKVVSVKKLCVSVVVVCLYSSCVSVRYVLSV